MSTLKRTPVNFPRMKVRGRRNKQKTAMRVTTLTVFPHAQLVSSDGVYEFQILPEGGTHYIESRTTVDGWGRKVSEEARYEPKPKPTFSMELQMGPVDAAFLKGLYSGAGS